MKPYAVAVKVGEKKSVKEFDTKEEIQTFLLKAKELKKKAPSLLVQIIRQPKPATHSAPTPVKKRAEGYNEEKENSLCWQGYIGRDGKRHYKCIPAPFKSKKVLYCPYCHTYKEWGMVDMGYGLKVKGCVDCGMTENDFYIKTANGLWQTKG